MPCLCNQWVKPMKKDEKQQQVDALREELAKARGVLLSGFEGITVAQDTDLRGKVAKAGAAIAETGMAGDNFLL